MATKKEKLRHALDVIDRFLVDPNNTKDGTAAALWNVMAALRGPDNDTISKADTTNLVRRAAFPRVRNISEQFTLPQIVPASFYVGGRWEIITDPLIDRMSNEHFLSHLVAAAEELDVPVEEGLRKSINRY